jgi:hypothetical protein
MRLKERILKGEVFYKIKIEKIKNNIKIMTYLIDLGFMV